MQLKNERRNLCHWSNLNVGQQKNYDRKIYPDKLGFLMQLKISVTEKKRRAVVYFVLYCSFVNS